MLFTILNCKKQKQGALLDYEDMISCDNTIMALEIINNEEDFVTAKSINSVSRVRLEK